MQTEATPTCSTTPLFTFGICQHHLQPCFRCRFPGLTIDFLRSAEGCGPEPASYKALQVILMEGCE